MLSHLNFTRDKVVKITIFCVDDSSWLLLMKHFLDSWQKIRDCLWMMTLSGLKIRNWFLWTEMLNSLIYLGKSIEKLSTNSWRQNLKTLPKKNEKELIEVKKNFCGWNLLGWKLFHCLHISASRAFFFVRMVRKSVENSLMRIWRIFGWTTLKNFSFSMTVKNSFLHFPLFSPWCFIDGKFLTSSMPHLQDFHAIQHEITNIICIINRKA